MKRLLTTALILGSFSTLGLVGCGDETKVKQKEEISTPGGSTTTTTETKIDSKGDNPPPSSTGETATSPPK